MKEAYRLNWNCVWHDASHSRHASSYHCVAFKYLSSTERENTQDCDDGSTFVVETVGEVATYDLIASPAVRQQRQQVALLFKRA